MPCQRKNNGHKVVPEFYQKVAPTPGGNKRRNQTIFEETLTLTMKEAPHEVPAHTVAPVQGTDAQLVHLNCRYHSPWGRRGTGTYGHLTMEDEYR